MGELGRIQVLSKLKGYYMELGRSRYTEARSTERWACDELAKYILDHPCEDPYKLILEFSDMLDRYSLKNSKTSWYFSEARAIVFDFYDEIGGH